MCYNITDGGEGNNGYRFTKEQKKRMSEAKLGVSQSPETIAKRVSKIIGKKRTNEQKKKTSIRVKQYSKNGEFIAEYFGINEASRQTGINRSHIDDCCNKKPNRKSAGGYIWRFSNDDDVPTKIEKENSNRKRIGQFNYRGELIKQWNSMVEIMECYNISRYKLQKFCRTGEINETNFIWKEL